MKGRDRYIMANAKRCRSDLRPELHSAVFKSSKSLCSIFSELENSISYTVNFLTFDFEFRLTLVAMARKLLSWRHMLEIVGTADEVVFFQWNRSIVQLDAENIKRSIIKWNYRTTMRIANVATLNTHKSGDFLHLDPTILLNICMTEEKAESTWIKLSINSEGRRRIGFSKICH